MSVPTPSSKSRNEPHDQLNRLKERWPHLSKYQKSKRFREMSRDESEELFLNLSSREQHLLFTQLNKGELRSWLRLLAPDDAADLVQHFPEKDREQLLGLIDEDTRKDVLALMAYAEDDAGGLMNPRFIRLRPEVTVDVAIRYLRAQAREKVETMQYAYVLDLHQNLLGVVSFRDLLLAPDTQVIRDMMVEKVVSVPEDMDQEEVGRIFQSTSLQAIPVVDKEGRMKGIVTVDDVVHVVEAEATEDMQKLGGVESLDQPYPQISLLRMIQKRAGWLTILFLGEMFTATAMGYFEHEIEKAVVLALFIPLIISSGGNSGSQATSLIIRALALRELTLRDWWKVLFKEILTGLALGAILGSIGLLRILLWPSRNQLYGEHFFLVAITVAMSLVGVVLWGSVAGSMLPFLLRKLNFDPATASAPFVATLVDVTGLVIYFTVASAVLGGTLL